jgi:hypothetical protein
MQHEDGQLRHGAGLDPDDTVTEVIEALAAAGQAGPARSACRATCSSTPGEPVLA